MPARRFLRPTWSAGLAWIISSSTASVRSEESAALIRRTLFGAYPSARLA